MASHPCAALEANRAGHSRAPELLYLPDIIELDIRATTPSTAEKRQKAFVPGSRSIFEESQRPRRTASRLDLAADICELIEKGEPYVCLTTAATSRLLFAYARDKMIFGSACLSKLSPHTQVPVLALLIAGLFPAAVAILGLFLENAIQTIIIFGSLGIYLSFQMIVLGALIARVRGWVPSGSFRLGAWAFGRLGVWAWPVNLSAFVYGVAAIVNMVWPRTPESPWYSNYAMLVSAVIVVGTGLFYMLLSHPYERGDAPAGDAHLPNVRLGPTIAQRDAYSQISASQSG